MLNGAGNFDTVKQRAVSLEGRPAGTVDANSLFEAQLTNIDFDDWCAIKLWANVIAEKLYLQANG